MSEDLIHINVGECTLNTAGVSLPVSKFDVKYALDTLPSAVIVLATGRNLEGEQEVAVELLEEGEEATVVLEVDDEEHILIEGFISSLSSSDNAGVFKRTTSLVVHLTHRAKLLAGSPPTSFAYTNDNQFLAVTRQKLLAISQFGTSSPEVRDDWDTSSGFAKFFSENGEELNSGSLMQLITENITRTFAGEDVADFAANNIQVGEGTKISKFALSNIQFIRAASNKYRESWVQSNAWEALVRTCSYLFLNIVPYNKGFYIAQPLSLARPVNIDLSPEDYISWSASLSTRPTREPVDGVVVSIPAPGGETLATKVSFPPLEGTDINLRGKKNRYYHYRQLPDWVYPYATNLYGVKTGKVSIRNRGAKQDTEVTMEGDTLREHCVTVGTELSKAMYSHLKMSTSSARMQLPFRTDLMPGTNIHLTSSDSSAVDFIGDDLYGMISSTHFSGDMTQDKGSLNLFIDVSTLRNSKDNNNDNMTFAEHPIYDKLWTGCDINGELLDA